METIVKNIIQFISVLSIQFISVYIQWEEDGNDSEKYFKSFACEEHLIRLQS